MNKQEKIDLIVAYMEGNVRDEEVELFYQLLETDKEFEELVGEYHQIDMLLEEMFPDDDEEDTFIENEFDVKDENQKKITLTTQMGKNQKTKKNMFLMRWVAASVLLLLSIGFIYYLNPSTKNNQKITKNKNQTDKSLDKKENINPKIDKDSLKNEKDNVVEKKEKIEIVLPEKEKIQELYADNFISNAASESKMLISKSINKTITFILPKSNDENFDKIILFDFKDSNKNVQSYTLEIITNQETEAYKKILKANELPLSVDFSKNEPGVYYFSLKTDNNIDNIHVGRFFFKKK